MVFVCGCVWVCAGRVISGQRRRNKAHTRSPVRWHTWCNRRRAAGTSPLLPPVLGPYTAQQHRGSHPAQHHGSSHPAQQQVGAGHQPPPYEPAWPGPAAPSLPPLPSKRALSCRPASAPRPARAPAAAPPPPLAGCPVAAAETQPPPPALPFPPTPSPTAHCHQRRSPRRARPQQVPRLMWQSLRAGPPQPARRKEPGSRRPGRVP